MIFQTAATTMIGKLQDITFLVVQQADSNFYSRLDLDK